MDQATLRSVALAWADGDPDPATAAEVRGLLEQDNLAELTERFAVSLEFGTAGLRGIIGGGTNRMNRAVVRRTTLGLARYLLATVPQVATRGVVVGRDGRLMSDVFTEDVAGVLAAQGIVAWVYPGVCPTPVTAFAVTHLGAAAGVMVTASHNPPEYNGYKVYWENGAQIVPPHDVGIAAAIDAVGPARDVPVLSPAEARARGLWKDVAPEVRTRYLAAIDALRVNREASDMPIVYTAMHGVGGSWMLEALARAGFTGVTPVPEQLEPDGTFPTVRFPNPEEKGAMDLSVALGEKVGAALVLANDPDADRLAVMARDAAGALRMLSGNEVGVVLGHFLLTRHGARGALVATTIVSSPQLRSIATTLGARCEELLTGFKWIANRAMDLERSEGVRFLFGYEEALGYTVGDVVRDKDGVGAALVMADLAEWCRRRGQTLFQYLEDIQREHGLYVARQYNAVLPGTSGAATIAAVMAAFRQRPPARFGELAVTATNDYRDGLRGLPGANVLAWELDGGSRITMRPSGTEPKLKVYLDLREQLAGGEAVDRARVRATGKLDALESAYLAEARARGLP